MILDLSNCDINCISSCKIDGVKVDGIETVPSVGVHTHIELK